MTEANYPNTTWQKDSASSVWDKIFLKILGGDIIIIFLLIMLSNCIIIYLFKVFLDRLSDYMTNVYVDSSKIRKEFYCD